jgi:ribose transport system ATP-binding protein
VSVVGVADVEALLSIRHVSKHFGGAQALSDVSLDLLAGETHGFVGANGAGKSTLIKILAGVVRADSGETRVGGRPTEIRNPPGAAALGFHFIHQELNLVPKFSARQNMVLGLSKPTRRGMVDWRAVDRLVRPVAERLGMDFSLDEPVQRLSVADRWLISIGRALVDSARLVAMDEPTASLSATEVDRLFGIIRELKRDGVAVIYVSHRLAEIQALCDRATVFKDGRIVDTLQGSAITHNALVRAIVGSEMGPRASRTGSVPPQIYEPVLEVRHLARAPLVREVSFTLGRYEVLGLAGLVGSGRTETARILFGADTPAAGTLVLDGRSFEPRSTSEAVRRGIALVPEERRSQGLVLNKSVRFNLALPNLRSLRLIRWLPVLNMRRYESRALDLIGSLGVQPARTDVVVGHLSGGNQQKVVIGKWLARKAKVLILDEPTRGVDIGARAEIHRLVRELADGGIGILMIASEFQELLDCDRVIVMDRGVIVGELLGADITEQAMLRLCYSAEAIAS